MYGRAMGMTVVGVGGHPVIVEAFVGRGLPSLIVTGLPGATVQDARDRIRPAVEHAGLEWPLRRVVVNLAPGNLRKEGSGLDLPIAVSVLAATGQVPSGRLTGVVVAGELSLRGEVLSTPGILSVVIAAIRARYRTVLVPEANAVEKAFNVTVTTVNVMVMKGKPAGGRMMRRKTSYKSDWKKAIVTLVAEDKIELFEGV